jgi:hypothetical protein
VNSGDGEQKKRRAGKQTCAATHGGRTQLLVAVVAAVAAFPISGSSSFLLCLSAFLLLLLLFCRFSISSSIPVDDGVVVAADGGMAVRVADRPCSALYFFFFFRLCFFSSFFFGLFQLPFFCALSSLVFIGKKTGGERPTTPAQSWRKGRVVRAATVQPPHNRSRGTSFMLLHHVVNHGSEIQQVGSGVDVFLKLSKKEGE